MKIGVQLIQKYFSKDLLCKKPKLYIPSTLNTDYLMWHISNYGLNHRLFFHFSSFLAEKTFQINLKIKNQNLDLYFV